MPKMKFNMRVKYKDEVHKGLEPFEVADEDVQEMQARGGVIVIDNKPKPKEPELAKEQEKKDDQKRGKKKAAGE